MLSNAASEVWTGWKLGSIRRKKFYNVDLLGLIHNLKYWKKRSYYYEKSDI